MSYQGSHNQDPIPDLDVNSTKPWLTHLPDEPIDPPFPIVSNRNQEELQQFGSLMQEDYLDFKEDLVTWLACVGKNPKKGKGLADSTLTTTHYKLEVVFRWLWRTREEYTTEITPEDADDFMELMVNFSEKSDSSLLAYVKSIKRYFTYLNYTASSDYEWECKRELSQSPGEERTYLKQRYFEPLYKAALSHSTVKSYNNKSMTAAERDQIKTYLSQRLGVPKSEVGPEEFKQATSWKIPSIIAVTLDVGLRPVEVGRVKTSWISFGDHELQVPREESTKNEEHWNCSLKRRTTKVLKRWLDERDSYEKYHGEDLLWLTERGTPYNTNTCNHFLHQLKEESDAPFPQDATWYSIRHGVATMWANNVGVHHAKEQLRHKSVQTTMKYLHSDSDTRGTAIENLW